MDIGFKIAVGVYDVSVMKPGQSGCFISVDVNMPVEVVGGSESLDEPPKSFDPLMGQVRFVVNPPWRSMGHEDIQVPSRDGPGSEKRRDQPHHMPPHFELRVLVRSRPVPDAPFNPGDDQPGGLYNPAMEIDAPIRVCPAIPRGVFHNA